MKTYKVLPGKSFLHSGTSYAPGSVVTEKSCGLPEKALTMMTQPERGILIEIDSGEAPVVAAPSGPAKPAGVVETERTDDAGDESVNWREMSKKELVAEAKSRNLSIAASATKDEIIAAIEKHDATPANVMSQFATDPMTLSGQTLDNLNLMVAERTNGAMGPFQTCEEAVAVLCRDFKKPGA